MAEKEQKLDEQEIKENIEEAADTAEVEDTEEIQAADEISEETEKDAPEQKKKFFQKDKKDKKDEKIAELNDRLVRQMAEFDNFRKRTEKEKQQMYSIGASEVVEKLLPVVDNFERGLAAMTEDEKETAFAQGIEMVYKQLMTVFEGLGVVPIEAQGVPFNPDFHNAVMQAPSETYESGMITQELQKGYMYKDKVVRHSMVMVAE